jgi:outer membrane protein assembly factor BamB
MKSKIAVFALLVGTLLWGTSLGAIADPWTTYQGDASHDGYVPITLNPDDFSLQWQTRVGFGALALNPVTAADGKVFVTELGYFSNAGLYVLDAQSGSALWQVNYGSVFSVNPPAYANGTVYVQTGNHASDTYLRAYDANTGAVIFAAPHAAQWERYYAPTIVDFKVYVNGGYYGGMYSFDALTGAQLWFTSLQQYDQWAPAVDATYAYAYVGSYQPGLYVRNVQGGTAAYTISDPGFQWNGWSMNQAPVLGGANEVLGFNGGRLISFDLINQVIGWQQNLGVNNQPSVANGVIYAIANGSLAALDESSGHLLWAWTAPDGALTGTLVVTDSHAFARTAANVYAIDLSTQNSVWSYPVSGHLALSEGTLYVADAAGNLTAFTVAPNVAASSLRAAGKQGARK